MEDRLFRALQQAQGVPLEDAEQVRRFVANLPLAQRGTYGGHTSCVQVSSDRDEVILDAGSGLYRLGRQWEAQDPASRPQEHHIFLTHLHLDHTLGLPHFAPLGHPGHRVVLYGAHPGFEGYLQAQHAPPSFPIPLSAFQGEVAFRTMVPGRAARVGTLEVDCMELPHPGRSFALRVRDGRSCLVYATDAEYGEFVPEAVGRYVDFFQGADVLVVDAQYDLTESLGAKRDWGHSSALVGARLALAANVRWLVLFHHDPASSDEAIAKMEAQVQAYVDAQGGAAPCRVVAAYEGLEIAL
ncbi:MAG: MBL fold metallo-hydrolase [Anaerolineae bacterium]|nr:MBL fold metallo-hydrolase [Anaerolineae bacterium]